MVFRPSVIARALFTPEITTAYNAFVSLNAKNESLFRFAKICHFLVAFRFEIQLHLNFQKNMSGCISQLILFLLQYIKRSYIHANFNGFQTTIGNARTLFTILCIVLEIAPV